MIRLLALALAGNIAFGCSADYRIWIPRSDSADPLYRFIRKGKAGYIDSAGRIVMPPVLTPYGNYGGEFHDGRLEIAVSDGRYVDRSGKVVIDGLYRGWDFSEGLAVPCEKTKNCGATSTRLAGSQYRRGSHRQSMIMFGLFPMGLP